jgi:hypothetical protein
VKVLEQFLISLGMKVDEKSFQTADNAFGGLTRSALQLGAVLAGKLAIDKVVGDFKQAGTELNNFNKLTGLSAQNVQMLGQAIAAQGGSAADAFSDMKKIQDLMASPITGDTGWFGDVAKLGLNPDAIIGAQDTAEALANIAGEFEHMSALNQRLAGNALGLDDSTVRLLMRGRAEVEKQLDVRGKLGLMTEQQIEDSARLTKASSELDLAFTDIGNTIAGELTPAFAEMAEDFVSFYRNNKDLVDSGLKEFFGGLADNIQLVAVAMALMGGSAALKGLATLRTLVGLGGAGAAARTAGAAGAAGAGSAAAGATAGASMLAVGAGGVAATLYSSKLNENEDTELLNNKLKKGGTQAAGATVDFFKAKGWTEEQAMGITANLQQESAFKADAEGDNGAAYGLAQWHKDRQASFAKFSGKDIRQSTGAEQLEFVNYELTKGNERPAGNKLRMAATPYEAASVVSTQYERPRDRDGEAARRGEIAESYSGSRASEAVSRAPELTAEQVAQLIRDSDKPERPETGLLEGVEAWLESHRTANRERPARDEQAATTAPARETPQEYTVNAVVQAPTQQIAPPTAAQPPAAASPSYSDHRQYHIHGADTEKVRQLLNEQMGQLAEQTSQDFRSPEQ